MELQAISHIKLLQPQDDGRTFLPGDVAGDEDTEALAAFRETVFRLKEFCEVPAVRNHMKIFRPPADFGKVLEQQIAGEGLCRYEAVAIWEHRRVERVFPAFRKCLVQFGQESRRQLAQTDVCPVVGDSVRPEGSIPVHQLHAGANGVKIMEGKHHRDGEALRQRKQPDAVEADVTDVNQLNFVFEQDRFGNPVVFAGAQRKEIHRVFQAVLLQQLFRAPAVEQLQSAILAEQEKRFVVLPDRRHQIAVGLRRSAGTDTDDVEHPRLCRTPGVHPLFQLCRLLADRLECAFQQRTVQLRKFRIAGVKNFPGFLDPFFFLWTERLGVDVIDQNGIGDGMRPAAIKCPHAEIVLFTVAESERLGVEHSDVVQKRTFDIHAETVSIMDFRAPVPRMLEIHPGNLRQSLMRRKRIFSFDRDGKSVRII